MSVIKQQMSDLLQKEMDRKDFLKHMGVAAVALIGVPAVIKALTQATDSSTRSPSTKNSLGYGSSAYGGSSAQRNNHKVS